ncbi:MAG: methylthioribulose 1-phosphate dehydratase [Acidiferrobacterales bacterium]
MAESFDSLPPRAALAEIARDFHARGWMAGTAGNLSARADREHFWITASGKPKGRLQETDFLLIRVDDGTVVERLAAHDKPSAETSIHRVIYTLFPDARACLHGHSIEACLAADRSAAAALGLLLPPLEMVKGFDLWEQSPKVELPLFENLLDVTQIAESVRARFRETAPAVSALLVRAHGATVWGRSLQEAYNRFEVLDFLLAYLARAERAG